MTRADQARNKFHGWLRDYAVAFTPAQWARLQAVFPGGVCDWSRRGEERHDAETWVAVD